jgi:hypothetical protein
MKSILIATSLCLASVASAQLSIGLTAPGGLATAIQTSALDQATLIGNFPLAPSLMLEGDLFTRRADFALGSIVASSTSAVDVAYIGKDSVDRNSLGVSDGSTNTLLYDPYSTASFGTAYHITAAAPTAVDFYHVDSLAPFGGLKWENDPLHFATYEFNAGGGKIYDILAIDDRGSELIDFQDGLFLVTRTSAVPEPSSFGLAGGAILLTAAYFRRRKMLT